MNEIVTFVGRLNFSHPKSVMGMYFTEILAVLAIVFGLSFLLFSWRHRRFYMGMVGMITGSWMGLMLKGTAGSSGGFLPFVYILACAMLGLFISLYFSKLMGILLGGFAAACVAYVFVPALFAEGQERYIAMSIVFLFGGGLGVISPKFFFIFNTTLIGSVFVTYGLMPAVQSVRMFQSEAILNLAIFLPMFIFGMFYQFYTTRGEAMQEEDESRIKEDPVPVSS